jgi:hypothetical protein
MLGDQMERSECGGALSLPHVLAGNSVSLKVIEASRANVRKLISENA